MKTATAPKKPNPPKVAPVAMMVMEAWPDGPLPLEEGQSRVDRERKLIIGVKLVGLWSKNTARFAGFPSSLGDDALDQTYGYTEDALREAVPLYEGADVYRNHPESGVDALGRRVTNLRERTFEELAGRVRNVRFVTGQGLFGDLQYFDADPMTPKLLEAAEDMPDAVAMSHRAFCQPSRVGGRVMVTKIVDVASVDLVTGTPGTTESLFESAPMTPPAGKPTAETMMPPGTPPATPTTEEMQPGAPAVVDPKTAITDGIAQAIDAIVRGDGSVKEKLPKIEALLTQLDATAEAMGGGKPSGGDAPPTNESAGLLAQYQLKQTAMQLLETAGVKVTTGRVSMLASAAAGDRPAIIAELKAMDGVKGTTVLENQPVPARSGGSGNPNPPGTPAAYNPNGLLDRIK